MYNAPVYVDLVTNRTTDVNSIARKRKLRKSTASASKRLKPTLLCEEKLDEVKEAPVSVGLVTPIDFGPEFDDTQVVEDLVKEVERTVEYKK